MTRIKAQLAHSPSPEVLQDESAVFGGVPTSGRGGRLKGEPKVHGEGAAEERFLDKPTRPWQDKEFIYLNGVPHSYTPNRELGTIIHLRGGGSMLLRDAYVRNLRISGPFVYRLDDMYVTAPATSGKTKVKWTKA